MKKILFYIAAAAMTAMTLFSCGPVGEEFNEEFLYGEWVSTVPLAGTNHEIHDRFGSDHRGSTKSFTDADTDWQYYSWTLEGATLTRIHEMEMRSNTRAVSVDEWTITSLTESKLVYRDQGGRTITCTKL